MNATQIVMLLAVALSFCSFLLVPSKVDVVKAAEDGMIDVEYTSLAGSSRDCVNMQISNKSARPLKLSVDPGLRVYNQNPHEQDILVTREAEVIVAAGKTVDVSLWGYCCESMNGTPGLESEFSHADYAGEMLCSVANHLNLNAYVPSMEQNAVWSVSNMHPIAGIYEEDATNGDQLREFCADLVGEEVPFYNIQYGDVLDQPFADEPGKLSGSMEYRVDETCKVDLILLDPDGLEMVQFFEDRLRHPRAIYKQNFNFEATSMKRGEYLFQLVSEDEVLEERSMTL
jgi:hypothetical protein